MATLNTEALKVGIQRDSFFQTWDSQDTWDSDQPWDGQAGETEITLGLTRTDATYKTGS